MGSQSKALQQVQRGSLCSGCGGCAAIAPNAISMQKDGTGYLRPTQTAELTKQQEQTVRDICPALGQNVTVSEGQINDPLWGPYVSMTVGHATDEDLRFAGSSGGALSAIAAQLLKTGQVDAVLQTAEDDDLPIGNRSVLSTEASEIMDAAGSRYAPSAPLETVADCLQTGQRFAFVGKPCDAAALRAWTLRDPQVAKTFPLILSFFCGGIPSETGARKLLDAMNAPEDQVISFRYRGNGWPGFATAQLQDGTDRKMSYNDSWGNVLSHHVQHRCKICADGTGMAADIVCADAWEADERGYPVFEEKDGISLIVARTALGQASIDDAQRDGDISQGPFDISGLKTIQRGQSWRRRVVLPRLLALRLMGKPVPRYRGLSLWHNTRQGTLKEAVTNFVGMIRRILIGRM